jgi:hypothetical protein
MLSNGIYVLRVKGANRKNNGLKIVIAGKK